MSNLRKLKSESLKIRLFSFLFITLSLLAHSQPDGEKLFKANCSACHLVTEKKLIGPGLKGAEERWESKELLYKWIKNSQEVIASGDAYANAIFEEYGKSVMPAQPVSDEDIDAILAYVANPPVKEDAGEEIAAAGGGQENEDEGASIYLVLGIIVILIVLVALLRRANLSLRQLHAEKNNLEVPAESTMYEALMTWIAQNKTMFALICIVTVVFIAQWTWNVLFGIGVYEAYQPDQPIAFSHEVHAGTNEIDCNYCHSSARNSKSAGIPSANVCMNCHKYITEGTNTGATEIAKIHAAIDFNSETRSYGENQKPIKWVKVHNLPDHVYFNHSQHVTVGKIKCQTCHGPVEEMTVAKQYSPLTMGWCINCHRETKVQMDDNGYYDEIHARLSEESKAKYLKDGMITVDELGGMECAKCHY